MVNAGITETYVILSGARSAQSKDLSRDLTVLRGERRRSFDSLRSLRMTNPFVLRLFAIFGTLIRIINCQFPKAPFVALPVLIYSRTIPHRGTSY